MLIVKVHNDGGGSRASASASYDAEVSIDMRTVWRGQVKGNRHDGWPSLLEEIAAAAWKSDYNDQGANPTALHSSRQERRPVDGREAGGLEWLDTNEAAKYLQIKTRTLLQWTRQGKIKGHALSGDKRHVWRYLRDDLDAALLAMSDTPHR